MVSFTFVFKVTEAMESKAKYSRLLISTPRVINRTDVEVPYLGG